VTKTAGKNRAKRFTGANMGIVERREREKSERRKKIIDCAKEVILKHGIQKVNMEDIAHKAELSKATVYFYFESKEVLLQEVCETSARNFLEYFKPLLETNLTGIAALKCFWRGYIEFFGNSDEIIVIFQVRSFLNSWLPIISLDEKIESPYVDAILESIVTIIDQCKSEGVFDPNLDSAMATRLFLSMFSVIVENAVRISQKSIKSPSIINEMTYAFQILIRGFAREGIEHSCLDITSD
jgi:AcrR family transcriptional regulator